MTEMFNANYYDLKKWYYNRQIGITTLFVYLNLNYFKVFTTMVLL